MPDRTCHAREAVAILWDHGLTAQAIADSIELAPKTVFYHLKVLRKQRDPRAHRRPQWTAQKRNRHINHQDW